MEDKLARNLWAAEQILDVLPELESRYTLQEIAEKLSRSPWLTDRLVNLVKEQPDGTGEL